MRILFALLFCLPVAASASASVSDQSSAGHESATMIANAEKSGLSVTLFFATGSHALSDAAKDAIEPLAKRFRHSTLHHFRIIGYADSRGSRNYNLGLSMHRANTVKDYLIEHGVHPARVETVAFGELRAAINILDTTDLIADRRVLVKVESTPSIGQARLAGER